MCVGHNMREVITINVLTADNSSLKRYNLL